MAESVTVLCQRGRHTHVVQYDNPALVVSYGVQGQSPYRSARCPRKYLLVVSYGVQGQSPYRSARCPRKYLFSVVLLRLRRSKTTTSKVVITLCVSFIIATKII